MYKGKPYITSYFSSSYVFKDSIDRVFEVYRNPELLMRAQEKFSVQIKPLDNSSDMFDTVGASFAYTLVGGVFCELTVENSTNEENYKMIQVRSNKVYPLNCNYRIKMCFYWCSLNYQTVLFEEVSFFHRQDPFLEELFFTYPAQMELRSKIIEHFLQELTFNLIQYESVIIRRQYKDVVNSVVNWNIFIQLSPTVADKVNIKGNAFKIGSSVTLYYKKEKSILTVVRNEEIEDKRYYELVLGEKNKKAPRQILKFTFIKVSENDTFLSFVHEFIEPIKFSIISKMEKNKKKILNELKRNLEKKCKKNSNL